MQHQTDYIDQLFYKIALYDDEEAYKELFFDFYPPLCVYANQILNSMETSKDLVQDVFFNLWKKRKTIKVENSFRNLMVTIVKNKCIDQLRKEERQKRCNTIQIESDEYNSPEELYTVRELEIKIADILSHLPENVREAFEKNRYGGLTYREIALEMQVSHKTVESWISRALKTLRLELVDYLQVLLF